MEKFKFVQATKSNEYQHGCGKDIQKREKLITIQISKYLSHTLAEILPAHNGIPVRRNGLTEFGVQPMMIAIFMIVLMWWLLKETIV